MPAEGRGLGSRPVSKGMTAGRLAMSLEPPEKVRKLQTALHAKAKATPDYRFYLLYDKLYRWDVLAYAYLRCKANQGAAGVDGQTFLDIEAYGERRWLEELAKELQDKTYQPSPVKRVWIPKPDGKQRPLGYRRSATAWCRWRRCWSSNRSSRPTCRRNNMPTVRGAARWTPCKRSRGCWTRAIRMWSMRT